MEAAKSRRREPEEQTVQDRRFRPASQVRGSLLLRIDSP